MIGFPDEMPRDDYADDHSRAFAKGWNAYRAEALKKAAQPCASQAGGSVMNHQPTPWVLTFIDKLPFGYQIHDANGELVVAAAGVCTSSKQRNREDHRNGVGFKWDGEWSRDSAAQAVAEQEETARYIVASANACKGNSTAWLEGYGNCLHVAENAKPLRANIDELTAQRDELEKRAVKAEEDLAEAIIARDALLEGLEKIKEFIEKYPHDMGLQDAASNAIEKACAKAGVDL